MMLGMAQNHLNALRCFCSICLGVKVQVRPLLWDSHAKGNSSKRWVRCCVLGAVFRFNLVWQKEETTFTQEEKL